MEGALETYLEELRRWGARTNLVGSTERDALAIHVADALTAAPHLPAGARVVDLGSGAGLPGIPLAIARADVHFTLVDIRERRIHFLRHVVRRLGLDCEVRRARIDEPPPEPFDLALVRALAPPRQAVPRARPWVSAEGEIWIWTSEPSAQLPWSPRAEIPLAARGAILRIPAPAVPRETP